MFEHKAIYSMRGHVPEGEYLVPIGVADVKREGDDVSVITYARQTTMPWRPPSSWRPKASAWKSWTSARSTRWTPTPSCAPSARPTARWCSTKPYALADSAPEIASQIQELAFDDLDAPVLRVGAAHAPVPFSEPLELASFPDTAQVVAAIRQSLQGVY